MFALNLLAQNLENSGVQTVISKDNNDDEEAITNLQFITSGLYNKKKYVLRFDFGDEKNEKLLEQGEDYDDFVNKLKQKLSKDFGVKPDEIIITYPEKGSFQLQIIFQSDEFNQLDTNELEKKFRNEKFFSDLKNLKSIHWPKLNWIQEEIEYLGGLLMKREEINLINHHWDGLALD